MITTEVKKNDEGNDSETVKIYVNTRPHRVQKNIEITYLQIVELAFPNLPSGDGNECTIQYTRGEGNKTAGSLINGKSVKVKEGMEFDVTPTNRS